MTGSSGFLGSILKQALQPKYEVADIQDYSGARIDITQSFDLDPQLEVDIVIHAAGKAHSVPRTREEEQAFFDVNFQGTVNLTKAIDALAQKPEAFIFISTVSVYGVDEGLFIDEEQPLKGESPYAKSKIMAEEHLRQWAKENNITLSILRLPLVAGPNPPGNLGAMIKGIKSGKYLSIGKASANKSIVWAEDIAQIIPKLVEQGGIFNLTDRYHPTFGELEIAISNALDKKKPTRIPLAIAKLMALVGDLLGAKAPINSNKLLKISSSLTFDDKKAVEQLSWSPSRVLTKIKSKSLT